MLQHASDSSRGMGIRQSGDVHLLGDHVNSFDLERSTHMSYPDTSVDKMVDDKAPSHDEREGGLSKVDSPSTDIPPLPVLRNAPVSQRNAATSTGQSTSFQPLAHTASRRSNASTRTFADSAMLVTALPNLSREETRISRIGRGYVAEVVREHGPVHEHEHEHENEHEHQTGDDGDEERRISGAGDKYEIIAVQVTPDGQELTFPDGGTEVSRASSCASGIAEEALGVALPVWGILRFVLWVRTGRSSRGIPDILRESPLVELLIVRLAWTLAKCQSFADRPQRDNRVDRQCDGFRLARPCGFYGLVVRSVRSQTPHRRRDCHLGHLFLLAVAVHRILPGHPLSCP